MEVQKKNKMGLLIFILLVLIAFFIVYFQMWMPKPVKQQFISAKDSIVAMVTGKKPDSSKSTKEAEEKGKSSEGVTVGGAKPPSEPAEQGAPVTSQEGTAEGKPSEIAVSGKPAEESAAEKPAGEKTGKPVESVKTKPAEGEAKSEEGKSKSETAGESSKEASAAELGKELEVGAGGKKEPWLSSPFKSDIPRQLEVTPQSYFSKPPYYNFSANMQEYILSAKSAAKYAAAKSASDSDKAFAGTAYFKSIEDGLKRYDLKNPFKPLVTEETGPLGKTDSGQGVEDVPDKKGGSSSSWTGGGRISSSDIWGEFQAPTLPRDGREQPSGTGNGKPGTNSEFTPPQDVTYPPGTLLINGSPVEVKGIAVSNEGGATLLKVDGPDGAKIIRTRIGQVIEGRFKVTDIQIDRVIITDLLSGKTYTLKLGESAPSPVAYAPAAENTSVLVTNGRG